jgi:hypothetical protein
MTRLCLLLTLSLLLPFIPGGGFPVTADALSPFAVTEAELNAAREQFFGIDGDGNFSLMSGTKREVVVIEDSNIIHKPQIYEVPEPPRMFAPASTANVGPFAVNDTRTFYTSTHGTTAQTGTLLASGTHTNVWVLNSPGTNAGTVTPAIAQQIANRFDPIYTAMTHPVTGFAPFANVRIQAGFGNMPTVGDLAGDGKVNFLLYDIDNDGASSAGFIGGFFTNGDFFTDANRNGLDMLHMDIGINQGFKLLTGSEEEQLEFYSTMAHEFQHMLFYMYYGVYRPNSGYNSDSWLNETLSELAGAFYTDTAKELVCFSRLSSAAQNAYDGSNYRDFLNHSGMKNYGMERLFGHVLQKRYSNITRNIYASMISTYPPAVNNAGLNANSAKITSMPQAVGDLLRAGTNIGSGGVNSMSLIYYLFMESFAADGGTIHGVTPAQSTKAFTPTAPPSNLWAVRPVMGVTGGRVFVSGTLSGSFYNVASSPAIPTVPSGTANSIQLSGYGSPNTLGASHEMLYRLAGGGAGTPYLTITAPNDGNAETRYYVAVPQDTLFTGATTYASGANGAALYPLPKGTAVEINTGGRDAYLFVVTLYRNVSSSVNYSFSATSNPDNAYEPPGDSPGGGNNNDFLDSGSITGDGETVYIDTNIYSVMLPTNTAWDFILDPQGLVGAYRDDPTGWDTGKDPSVTEPFAGRIISRDYVPTAINNSSFDVSLSVTLKLTGDAVAVTSESAVHSGTGNNVLLTIEPAAGAVSTRSAVFIGSGSSFAVSDEPGVLKFVLAPADYVFNHVAGSDPPDFTYTRIANTGKGTQFRIGGQCNKNADWTDFADDTKGVGINAVFSFAPATAADKAMANVSGAYGQKDYGLTLGN